MKHLGHLIKTLLKGCVSPEFYKKVREAINRHRETIPEMFAHEYELDGVCLIKPRGHNFHMYVTPRYRSHYEQRSYEPFTASLLSSILPAAKLFIDIGASYGFYSLLAASRTAGLHIIAIEPTPETCAVLQRNVDIIGPPKNVAVHQIAVSDAVGLRKFNVALASDSCGFFDHPNIGTLRCIDVETTTVDALLKDLSPCPVVIKIDTEGSEFAVLSGMVTTLARFPDIELIIEYNPSTLCAAHVRPASLLERLDQLGFETFFIDEERRAFHRAKGDYCRLSWTIEGYANLYCVRRAAQPAISNEITVNLPIAGMIR